jgi:ubiquinone/menaquinone biosynthesis C-methylase UbiE/DNA-binding transcriptional ArsR family regulator
MATIVNLLRAISDPTRLRLVLLLLEEELTVAELQEILGMAQSRISASLALLKREAMARNRRVGKNIFYAVRPETVSPLRSILEAATRELPEAASDRAAMTLALRKRKDKAADYFNKLAGKFGRTYIPGRSWQALAHALLRLLPAMVIADLGAGEGTLSQLLARGAKQVIAIDNSEKMVEFGSNLAREHGCGNLEYRLGDIEDPPIEHGTVDLALFSQALHHASSPQKAVLAAHRILREGGRVVVLDLASHSHEEARDLYAHVWLGFSEVELEQVLAKAGFSEIEVSVVSRETQAPNFQTLLAIATK